jgi:hypothetical protein
MSTPPRALVLVDAASQVVSLWSVADASTCALMREYDGALQHRSGRAEAAMRQVATHSFYGSHASLAGAATRGRATRRPWLDPLRGQIGALPPLTHDLSDALDQAGLAMADANRGQPASSPPARSPDSTGRGRSWWCCRRARPAGARWHRVTGTACGGRWCSLAPRRTRLAMERCRCIDTRTDARLLQRAPAGIGRAEALRRAKQRLLQKPEYAHPSYWAAFILAGDWLPLGPTAFQPQRSTL